ncbi:MAG: hypothetical protein AAB131_21740, partial [Actinomycetota bacterium]
VQVKARPSPPRPVRPSPIVEYRKITAVLPEKKRKRRRSRRRKSEPTAVSAAATPDTPATDASRPGTPPAPARPRRIITIAEPAATKPDQPRADPDSSDS